MATIARTMLPAARRYVLGSTARSLGKAAKAITINRTFQSSSSLLKKSRKASEVEEAYPEEESIEDEEDLFASSSSSSTPSIRDPSAQLQPLLAQLTNIMALDLEDRKGAFSSVRVGALRRIVQLYPAEEVEGLKGVLRIWRTLGGRVTRKTAEEIVGRLCNIGKADLALELINDRTQYGLPALPTHSQTRLHHSLLQSSSPTIPPLNPSIPLSKTLATLHLALRQKAEQDPISQADLSRLVGSIKNVKIEVKDAEGLRKDGREILERAGGIWADAAKRIESAPIA